MKLKDFKVLVNSIPIEFDDYDIIYSEIQNNNDETYYKIDDEIVGIMSDDENKDLCFMGKDSDDLLKKINKKNNKNCNETNKNSEK
jgi:hypothetical protein